MLTRIMHVDDNRADRELLAVAFDTLSPVDVSYVGCASGQDCLGALSEVSASTQVPHGLIIDINMPEMNGFELLEKIRAAPEWNRVAVMMLSSSRNPKDRDTALRLGAQRYEVKPPLFDDMLGLASDIIKWLHAVSRAES